MGILTAILMVINFGISWYNARTVGRIWSESKQIGGGTRVLVIAGYAMSIIGFTMVYSIIIILLVAFIGPATGYLSSADTDYLLSLISNLTYVLITVAALPTGMIIWINSLIVFWKRKSLKTGGIAAWNTFANVSRIVNASRYLPSAITRLANSTKKSNGKGGLMILAIIAVLCAILGGYFTASAIMKKADREYDLFNEVLHDQEFA